MMQYDTVSAYMHGQPKLLRIIFIISVIKYGNIRPIFISRCKLIFSFSLVKKNASPGLPPYYRGPTHHYSNAEKPQKPPVHKKQERTKYQPPVQKRKRVSLNGPSRRRLMIL